MQPIRKTCIAASSDTEEHTRKARKKGGACGCSCTSGWDGANCQTAKQCTAGGWDGANCKTATTATTPHQPNRDRPGCKPRHPSSRQRGHACWDCRRRCRVGCSLRLLPVQTQTQHRQKRRRQQQQRRRIAAAAAAGEMLVRPVMSNADATLNRPNRVALSKRLETTPTVSLQLAVSKAAAHCNQRGGSRVCDFNAATKKAEAFGTKLLRKWGRQQQQQQQQPPLPKGLTAGQGIRRAQLRAPCAARATVLRQARLQPCWVSMGKKGTKDDVWVCTDACDTVC